MSSPVFSPRRRRLLARAALLAGVAAGVAAVISLLPSRAPEREDALGSGPPQVVRAPKDVPVTAARRRAIDSVLDRFIPAALGRKNLDVVRTLVTPSWAAGVSDAQWRRGEIPVLPYKPRDRNYSGWTVHYSYPREISLDVLVHPSKREELGAIAFTAVVKKQPDGRWLISEFVPAAVFAKEKKAPRILAQPDFQPNMVEGTTNKSTLSASWLLVPVALLALIALVPLVVFTRTKLADRRAMKSYRGLYERIT
jgi:hypothetical protein